MISDGNGFFTGSQPDIVFGDLGEVEMSSTGQPVKAQSVDLSFGDADFIVTGGGSDAAFGGNNPILKINPFTSDTEKSEQRGFTNLLKGLFFSV